jgi:hypothetical protein
MLTIRLTIDHLIKILITAALLVLSGVNNVFSQTIPAGISVLDETIRRGQLLGDADLTSSFMLKPLYPRKAFGVQNAFKLHERFISKDTTQDKSIQNLWKGRGRVQILPIETKIVLNTSYPFGRGDGPMIRARGFQQFISTGIFAEYGPLSIQFRPETVWAQNKSFGGFNYTDELLSLRNNFWLKSEDPERFGYGAYNNTNPGQSSIRLNVSGFSLGLSNENIWWGPGQFNAIVFSNNAQGFRHLTFNTTRPLRTIIGHFEGQILAGRLEGLRMPVQPQINRRLDWRYLNAMNIVYLPKWLPGLSLGLSRTFQQYRGDMEPEIADYLPLFQPFQKKKFFIDGNTADFDEKGQDQQVAVSVRWVFQEAHAEIYFEFGRRDHAYNWRDFIMSPEHARAFLFGFSKLISLTKENSYIQIRSELTQSQESINILSRYGTQQIGNSWGQHTPVIHGFTHQGQQLGNGIGPGNNVQIIEISHINNLNKTGLYFERMENQMDFFTHASWRKPFLKPWVDLSAGFILDRQFDKLLISSKLQFVRSLNYQWQIQESFPGSNVYKGVDKSNLFSRVSVVYLF